MYVAASIPVLATGLLFVLTHSTTTARPQGRALISSPSLNKYSSDKQDSYVDYFYQSDGKDHLFKNPTYKRTFKEKKMKHQNDRRTYNVYGREALYETQFEENQQYPNSNDGYKESFSRDDSANTNYGGLGVILGRQNPLSQLG